MNITATCTRRPWNKGKLVGQKTPLRLRDIWAIRVRLQLAERTRDLALFDLAIDSKLRACDLTKLRVCDVAHGEHVSSRAMVMQQKTKRPVQFEITEQTRSALAAWIHQAQLRSQDCLFPSRLHTSDHLSTRQYARIVKGWVQAIGLDPAMYGTHTMRRTKASLIYRRTKNLRIPRHSDTQPTLIRTPVPRSFGQAVGAQRRRGGIVSPGWLASSISASVCALIHPSD